MKLFVFLLLLLPLANVNLFAEEKAIETPVLSGEIVDKINLPSADKLTIYLIVQDEEKKVWSCKVGEPKLLEEAKEFNKGEYVKIYGSVTNLEARQVEAKRIEKQPQKAKESEE